MSDRGVKFIWMVSQADRSNSQMLSERGNMITSWQKWAGQDSKPKPPLNSHISIYNVIFNIYFSFFGDEILP